MKKFDNFCKALNNLEDIKNYNPPYDNVVLTGLVFLYQICFEQAWKAMKECLENDGVNTSGSPRSIIKDAYKFDMIENEDAWLDALKSRNEASHIYNEQTALEVIKKINDVYLDLFHELKRNIEQNWL